MGDNMNDKYLAINNKFFRMLCPKYDIPKAHIIAGVMLLDEYRLHQWLESGRPAKTIVDVGGHYGSFTAMAKILWPESTVRVYEPHPYSASQIERHTAEFDGVRIVNAAAMPMSYTDTKAQLYLGPDANDGGHTIGIDPCNSDREVLQVKSVRFVADLQSIGSPAIDVLKLDCEGMESALLEDMSASGYLAKVDYICGEWHRFESIPRIEAALQSTHIVEVVRCEWPNGAFFAWRR